MDCKGCYRLLAGAAESFLRDDLSQARIIMYGYDADVVKFGSMASQNTVGDHSQKLLSSLANL